MSRWEKLKRLRIISSVGLCSMVVGFVMLLMRSGRSLPVTDYLMGVSSGIAFGALVTAVFYSTGILASIRKYKEKKRLMKNRSTIAIGNPNDLVCCFCEGAVI
ncbi:MAG: hypothetical protein ACI4EW_02330 [Butyrivibrio sp.]